MTAHVRRDPASLTRTRTVAAPDNQALTAGQVTPTGELLEENPNEEDSSKRARLLESKEDVVKEIHCSMSSLEAKLGLFLTFLTLNGGGNIRGIGMEVEN